MEWFPGEVDRDKLGDMVFNDVGRRRQLNKATQLPIAVELAKQIFKRWISCKLIVVRLAPFGRKL